MNIKRFSKRNGWISSITAIVLAVLIAASSSSVCLADDSSEAEDALYEIYEAYSSHDWTLLLTLTASREADSMRGFIDNYSDTHTGIFNIRSADIVQTLPLQRGRSDAEDAVFFEPDFYYGAEYAADGIHESDVACFLSLVEFRAYEPDEFIYSGLDYRVDTLVRESGEWRLAFSERPEPSLLEAVYENGLPVEAKRYIEQYDLRVRTGIAADANGNILNVNNQDLKELGAAFPPDNEPHDNEAFSDVAGSPYMEFVSLACQFGLMDGCSTSLFDTESDLTVAQAIKVAGIINSQIYKRSLDEYAAGSNDAWYDKYISYASANGLIENEGDIVPSAPIALPQLFEMLLKALPEKYLPRINPTIAIKDASPEVEALIRAGILSQEVLADNTQHLSREKAAAVFVRMICPEKRLVEFESV